MSADVTRSAAAVTMCRCLHSQRVHPAGDDGACSVCDCEGFVPADQPAPVDRPASERVTPAQLARAAEVSPSASPPRPVEPEIAARGERPPTFEQILQAGKRSEFKRTVALAEKIATEVQDLRGRLQDERQAAEEKRRVDEHTRWVRSRIADLEKQLADARGELRAGPASPGTAPAISGQPITCPEAGCDRSFAQQRGLTRHLNQTHGHRQAS